jgi:DNA polymerase-3 subunit alpha
LSIFGVAMSDFVHLHLHSEYSLLDGACRVSDIPKAAKAAGHDAVAITDHGVMYGAVAFYRACMDEGVKPIIGCEIYVAPRTRFDRTHGPDSENYHLVLLCKDEIGYRNLIHIVSRAFTEGFYSKPRADMELLEQRSEGLIALSACLGGYIQQAILRDDMAAAEEYARKLESIFGRDNFYLELQDHGLAEQEKVNAALAELSERTGIPLVATNDVHYIRRQDADTQAILMCIQTNNVITDGRPLGFETDEFYYKSTDEMRRLFSGYRDALSNTVKIAERCNFRFEFGKVYLPAFTPPGGMHPDDYLRKLANTGLAKKLMSGEIVPNESRTPEQYRERVDYELSVIAQMGYSEYFLIVADFVGYAKSHDIPTGPGRGSGAGSLVAYLTGITDVDPLFYDLLFEAFLNPERVSMPDFDIDFCYNRRDEVIAYVCEKYGHDHVAQIITFGTMAARAAVRDVGRALGMSYAEVDRVAKLIPQRLGITLEDAMLDTELRSVYDSDPKVRRLLDISRAVEGMPRHASTHAAGVVITDRPLETYVPLAVNGEVTVTQYDMDTVAMLGLLKFDFLGLRYLTIIDECCRQVRQTDPGFDLKKIPRDDEAAFAMISSGHTDGMFQLESGGMRQLLIRLRPQSIEDIMISIALYRPGPMDAIPKYLENRADPSKIKYKITALAEILNETSGVIVYQEQVMQIFRAVAGYSYGRADIVRRAISKKKADVIEAERTGFIEGAVKLGCPREDAVELFEDMTAFANYGFKKGHAAAYAIISYQTAYLKAHYPGQYLAALMTSVLSSPSKLADYIAECTRLGIKLLPPDINESGAVFRYESPGEEGGVGAIRYGLLAVKGVGEGFIKKLIIERETNGRFTSLYNYISRTVAHGGNRRQAEALIKSGALDCLGAFRSRMLAVYEKLFDIVQAGSKNELEGQLDLFGADDEPQVVMPEIPEFGLRELLALEREATGLYFSGHISDQYKDAAEALGAVPINRIKNAFAENPDTGVTEHDAIAAGKTVTVAGIITKRTNKLTRSGEPMAFVTLEDRYADMELIVFPKVLTAYDGLLTYENAIAATGELSVREDAYSARGRGEDESAAPEPKLLVRTIIPLAGEGAAALIAAAQKAAAQTGMTHKPAAQAASPQKTAAQEATAQKAGNTPPGMAADGSGHGAQGNAGRRALERTTAPQAGPDEPLVYIPAAYRVNIPASPSGNRPVQPQLSDKPAAKSSNTAAERQSPVDLAREKPKKLYLRVPDTTGDVYRKAVNLAEIFEGNAYGKTETMFYDASTGKYSRFEPGVCLSDFVLGEFVRLLGKDNVVLK